MHFEADVIQLQLTCSAGFEAVVAMRLDALAEHLAMILCQSAAWGGVSVGLNLGALPCMQRDGVGWAKPAAEVR